MAGRKGRAQKVKSTQGSNAARAGELAQKTLQNTLKDLYGFTIIDMKGDEATKARDACRPPGGIKRVTPLDQAVLFAYIEETFGPRTACCKFRESLASMYGVCHEKDAVIVAEEFPEGLIVEVKTQDIGGSVDEKFPFVLQTAITNQPAHTLVLIEGDGFRAHAVEWLLNGAAAVECLTVVSGMGAFRLWARENLGQPHLLSGSVSPPSDIILTSSSTSSLLRRPMMT